MGVLVWVNHRTCTMAAATPLVKLAICPCKQIRKVSERHCPMILMVCLDIPGRCSVMDPPTQRECNPIS